MEERQQYIYFYFRLAYNPNNDTYIDATIALGLYNNFNASFNSYLYTT